MPSPTKLRGAVADGSLEGRVSRVEFVRSVLSLQQQVKESGTPANSCAGAVFEELARGSSNPTVWIDAPIGEGAEPGLVWCFVRRVVNEGGEVAAAMAAAYYIQDKHPSGELGTAWRGAVIDTARVEELPGHGKYCLKDILKEHP